MNYVCNYIFSSTFRRDISNIIKQFTQNVIIQIILNQKIIIQLIFTSLYKILLQLLAYMQSSLFSKKRHTSKMRTLN